MAQVAPNSLDLRGNEHHLTLKDAEIYAATMGYDFLYFGFYAGARDVDPALKMNRVNEAFWTAYEHRIHKKTGHVPSYPGRVKCVNCGEDIFKLGQSPWTLCSKDLLGLGE
tara:strand:+ start:39 stop:371 length:333 start_codon:yes stop_codon:yes gene_type:complete